MKLKLSKIAEFISAINAKEAAASAVGDDVAIGYSIDSRTIAPGQLFFAVIGERLDGHDYVQAALDRGAVGAVVRKDQLGHFQKHAHLLAVDDTLVALQALATAVRRV